MGRGKGERWMMEEGRIPESFNLRKIARKCQKRKGCYQKWFYDIFFSKETQ